MSYKYIYLVLETRDSEREYNHYTVHKLDKDKDIDKFADEYCSDFWGESEKLEDGDGYEFFGGEIITKVERHLLIPKDHYDILKHYL